ncbi:MAG: hypothetical protein IPM77_13655 [Crocinitomicaceae bacterium]|nr:hypothetical protein [Crocinitomicaceae bacterium]
MGIKEELSEMQSKIAQGLEKAYLKMIEFKIQKNSPLVISRDGKIIEIPASELREFLKNRKK